MQLLGRRCYSIGGLFRSMSLSAALCIVATVCVEVAQECRGDISNSTTFVPPACALLIHQIGEEREFGGHNLTFKLRPNGAR